jgi:5-(carboxyamino)imidazole ribonucleotide synthase
VTNPCRYPSGVTFPVVGVVGGGQLARMMQPPAIALGVRLTVLCDSAEAAAAQVVPWTVVGNERGYDDLAAFAKGCDVLTFDHEHVPTEHLYRLVDSGVVIRPAPQALVHAQDKGAMRARLYEIGIPCPRHRIVDDPDGVAAFAAEVIGWPVVLKTVRGGYDGKGVWIIDSESDPQIGQPFLANGAVLAEERVDNVRELSAVVARSPHGQAVAYPVVESVQAGGICAEVVAPAPRLPDHLALEAQRIALRIAHALDVVGILAVELFETRDGRLLVNELAMRPHNTGHWSIDGAVTSQFENHLRAVLDLPLGSPIARHPWTVMVNVFGGDVGEAYRAYRHILARDARLKVHWYGKSVRPGRKVGHVTVSGDDLDDLRAGARHAAAYLRGDVNE